MAQYTTIFPSEIPVPQLHGLLLSAVAPRPIAFASTIDRKGRVNLSPFSFYNVFGANPPILVFSPARRIRDNTFKHTLENVVNVPEVVIHAVSYSMVEQMSLSSTEYDKGVNEFIKAGFTELPSTYVRPPRVAEAPVAMECSVQEIIDTGEEAGAGVLVVVKVLAIHIREEYLDENGNLDTRRLDLVARMGGNWYCRANGDALFEIPKPLRTLGIGVDQLPASIRLSSVLTGNNLGRLANVEQLPDTAQIDHFLQENDQLQQLLAAYRQGGSLNDLHRYAQSLLEQGHTQQALMALMAADSFSEL